MKKILFLDQSLGSGGAERVMCTVIRAMPVGDFELHLLLISSAGPLIHLIPDHVKVHLLGVSNTRKSLFAYLKMVWAIRPDLVYVTSSRTAVLALLGRYFCPEHKIVARYSSMPAKDIETRTITGWRLWLTRTLYRRADFVIAQTVELAEQLKRVLRIPPYRLHQIDNPVDTSYIEQSLESCVCPFPENTVNVLAVGTIYHLKGFDILVKAIAKVREHDKRFHLHILGSDQQGNQAKLIELAQRLEIADAVSFHGFKPNPYAYYKYCDLFVLSSRQEAMPNVLLECLYFGKPVVATRCAPVIDRLVDEGVNGFRVDVENVEQMAAAILAYEKLTGKKQFVSGNGIVELLQNVT